MRAQIFGSRRWIIVVDGIDAVLETRQELGYFIGYFYILKNRRKILGDISLRCMVCFFETGLIFVESFIGMVRFSV